MDKIIENLEADIPEAMVETQLDRIADDFSYRLAMQGMEFESYLKMTGMTMEQFRSVFAPQALRQVKIRLALEKIAELEGMDITEEDLNAEFDKLVLEAQSEMDEAKRLELYKQAEEILLLEEYVVNPILFPSSNSFYKNYVQGYVTLAFSSGGYQGMTTGGRQ